MSVINLTYLCSLVLCTGMSTPVPPAPGGGRNLTGLTPAILRQSVGYRLRMKQGRKSKQRSATNQLIYYTVKISVSDPYSLNPDPAKNLNPDPGKFFSPTKKFA